VEPEAHNRFIDGILSESARLGFLIDQLLKIQQIEQGKLPMHKVLFESGPFLETFTGKWHRPLQLRILSSAPVEADPMLLELALANLVSNAEKYGRGGVPEIELSSTGGEVQFTVRDHARPIDRKDYKRIFQKFYRLSNTETKRQTGVGLGLYIVKYIVATLHHGSVHVSPIAASESRSEGNEFSLRLPAP